MRRGNFRIGEIERRRGVAVTSSFSSPYNRRSPDEFELNSHDPHPFHQSTYRGRGGRGRGGFQSGSRGNRRDGFGGPPVDPRPGERSQPSPSSSFGGLAQGFPGAPTRQEKETTAAFTRQMEMQQDKDGGCYTDDDDKEETDEEEVAMVKKATEKEDCNSGFGEEIQKEAKKYGGIDDEEKEEHEVMKEKEGWYSGFGEEIQEETKKYGGLDGKEEPKFHDLWQLPCRCGAAHKAQDCPYSGDVEPGAKTGGTGCCIPPADPPSKPEPSRTTASSATVQFLPLLNPKPVPSVPTTLTSPTVSEHYEFTIANKDVSVDASKIAEKLPEVDVAPSEQDSAQVRQGPAGIVYSLETEFPLPPVPSRFNKKVVTQTFEIQGRQIVNNLSRVMIYEAHLRSEKGCSQVYISGATINSVCLREVREPCTFYEVPYTSLHIYERVNKQLPQPDAEQIPPTVPPKTGDIPEKQKPIEITSDDGWGDTSPQSANPVIAHKTKPGVHTSKLASFPSTPFPSKPVSVVPTKSTYRSRFGASGGFGTSICSSTGRRNKNSQTAIRRRSGNSAAVVSETISQSDVKPSGKTGGSSCEPPPSKPNPTPVTPAASTAVPSLPSPNTKPVASSRAPVPKAFKSTKQGPDGIVYTLDPKLPIRRKRSFGRLFFALTKEIQGGQIATHLETEKIYEVLVNCQIVPALVTIEGAIDNAVVFCGLGLRMCYEAPFDSLRIYEVSGNVPSSLKPARDLPAWCPPKKQGPDGIVYTIDSELSTTPTLAPSDGKMEFALTKKICGAEIVNHLQTDKVYEVRLNDRTSPSRFEIYGATWRFVVLRELHTNNYYEVPYDALHLYERGPSGFSSQELSKPASTTAPEFSTKPTPSLKSTPLSKPELPTGAKPATPINTNSRECSDDGWEETLPWSANSIFAPMKSGPSGFGSRGLPKPASISPAAPELPSKSTPPTKTELPTEAKPAAPIKSSSTPNSEAVVSAPSSAAVQPLSINMPSPTVPAATTPSQPVIARVDSLNVSVPAAPTSPSPGPEEQPRFDGIPNIHQAIIKLMNCNRMRDAIKKSNPALYDAMVQYILDNVIAPMSR